MSINNRDEFSQAVRFALAQRAGHRCSEPDCRAPTAGPQLDNQKVLNIGVAAHITAASEGGPRYDSSLTSEQRSDIANGIWLCQTHAKLVDNDAARFSADLLHVWKQRAEQRALAEIGRSGSSEVQSENERKSERIRAQLQLRNDLKSVFLKKPGTIQKKGQYLHPYEKFRVGRILI